MDRDQWQVGRVAGASCHALSGGMQNDSDRVLTFSLVPGHTTSETPTFRINSVYISQFVPMRYRSVLRRNGLV